MPEMKLTGDGKKEAFRQFAESKGYAFIGKLHGDSLAIQRGMGNDFTLLIMKTGKTLVKTEFSLFEDSTLTIEGVDVTTGVSLD